MFHAVVAIKQVPDTTNIRIDPETGNLVRAGVPAILNPYDAHALAAAVEWKGKLGGKVTVISMGPPSFKASIGESIELGADRGILISARQFSGADTLATSYVLAKAIEKINSEDPIDVIFFGKQAIDGDTAQVGPGVSVRLGIPVITYCSKINQIDCEEKTIVVQRNAEIKTELIRATLPVVLTCEKEIAKVPFASLPNLVKALQYEPEIWGYEEPLELEREKVGTKGSPTIVYKTATPEQPVAGELLDCETLGVVQVVETVLAKDEFSVLIETAVGGR